jgi:hypothetical protein
MKRSPTLEGFKLIFRQPSLSLAEIAWRWSFGGAAAALFLLFFLEYLDTLTATNADLFLLRTKQPALVARAIGDILSGSGLRFVVASIVLGSALSLVWVAVASFGRAVTLKCLLGYFWTEEPNKSFPFRMTSLFALNFLRAGVTMTAAVGGVGAMVLGGMVSSKKNPAPGSALLIFLFVATLVWVAWAVINWFLSLSSVLVVARNEDALGAIGAAIDLFRDHVGSVFGTSAWFLLAHGVAFMVASVAISFPLAFSGVLPPGVTLLGILFFALLYFAVADVLYIARLGAYVWILEGPAIAPEPEIVPEPPVSYPPPADNVDPSELILSDIPAT